MSFLSLIIDKDFLSIMADSRISRCYIDRTFYDSVDENGNKIIPITSCAFYAITGTNEEANDFILKSNMIQSIIDNELLVCKKNIDEWFDKNKKFITNEFGFHIFIGGKEVNSDLVFYIINSRRDEIVEYRYEGELKYYLSISPEFKKADELIDKFRKLYYSSNKSLSDIINIQEQLNDFVADNDPSVNKVKKRFVVAK